MSENTTPAATVPAANVLHLTDTDGAEWSVRFVAAGETYGVEAITAERALIEFVTGADVDDPDQLCGRRDVRDLLRNGSVVGSNEPIHFGSLRTPETMDAATADEVRAWAHSLAYEARCVAAATSQGLDPIMAVLDAAGVTHGVEQTGGFTMAVSVAVPAGTYVMNAESSDETRPYLLGFFPGDAWTETGTDDWCHDIDTAGLAVWAHAVAALQAAAPAERVQELETGIRGVVDAWESGDLAGAVNDAAALLAD